MTTIGVSTVQESRITCLIRHGWHTDGYYNEPGAEVRVFLLHCVQPARRRRLQLGLSTLDVFLHELQPAMLNMWNTERQQLPHDTRDISDGRTVRAEISVPVFALADDTTLLTRYTERKHNAIWSQAALIPAHGKRFMTRFAQRRDRA